MENRCKTECRIGFEVHRNCKVFDNNVFTIFESDDGEFCYRSKCLKIKYPYCPECGHKNEEK